MRLLFLTNFYPPVGRGGYEQWCQEIALGMLAKGHKVFVLTSRHQGTGLELPDPEWVARDLHLEMEIVSLRNAIQFFTVRKAREKENLSRLNLVIKNINPDAILIWGMWNLHRSIPALAEKLMPGRVAYYMGDYWPTLPNQFENYWQAPARNLMMGIPKMALIPIARRIMAQEQRPDLQLEHMIFPSSFMRDEFSRKGISVQNAPIIYGAIDTSPYKPLHRMSDPNGELSLFYIGRLAADKGVHTSIEALGILRRSGFDHIKLTVVGNGEPEYESRLHKLVKAESVDAQVTFMETQPKEKLAGLYQQADVLLFTSIWPEPFGRVIVEAMASGVAVIGAGTGGALEIMTDNENSLVFTPGSPKDLAEQLMKFIKFPELRERLTKAGRETATTKFDIQRMTAEIETYLQTLLIK